MWGDGQPAKAWASSWLTGFPVIWLFVARPHLQSLAPSLVLCPLDTSVTSGLVTLKLRLGLAPSSAPLEPKDLLMSLPLIPTCHHQPPHQTLRARRDPRARQLPLASRGGISPALPHLGKPCADCGRIGGHSWHVPTDTGSKVITLRISKPRVGTLRNEEYKHHREGAWGGLASETRERFPGHRLEEALSLQPLSQVTTVACQLSQKKKIITLVPLVPAKGGA